MMPRKVITSIVDSSCSIFYKNASKSVYSRNGLLRDNLRIRRRYLQHPVPLKNYYANGTLAIHLNNRSSRNFSTTTNVSDESKNKNKEVVDDKKKTSLYYYVNDENDNWEDWFTPEEYGDPWDNYNGKANDNSVGNDDTNYNRSFQLVKPLDEDPKLDRETRYAIQLLQDLYHMGGSPVVNYDRMDRIRLERCNSLIQQLASSAKSITHRQHQHQQQQHNENKREKTIQINNLCEQRAMRADSILKTMELLQKFAINGRTRIETIELPIPTYETYINVLQLYGTVIQGSDQIPNRCIQIVNKMNDLYYKVGDFAMKPTTAEYNQILSAWANSDNPEKALHAAKYLIQVMMNNGTVDTSSYGHVLRACAHDYNNPLARKIGSKVAIQLWDSILSRKQQQQHQQQKQERKQNNSEDTDNIHSDTPIVKPVMSTEDIDEIPFTTHMYAYFLKACGHLLRNTGKQSAIRDQYILSAFVQCCDDGLVNHHVLERLKQVASSTLYDKITQTATSSKSVESPNTHTKKEVTEKTKGMLSMDDIPQKWKQNVKP